MHTKADNPITLLQGKNTLPLIETYFQFAQLKQLYRQGWLKRGVPPEQCESVAEHTLGVAVLSMLLADTCFAELDTQKVLRMALLHDFGEIDAGDFTPMDGIPLQEKHRLEKESILDVLSGLPNGADYAAVWDEFEEGKSPEAQFIRQVDRLEMGLQASIYELQGLLKTDEFLQSASHAQKSEPLKDIIQELLRLRTEET